MNLIDITGTCHCGNVKYTAQVDAEKIIACHCVDCQIMSAAPFRVVAPIPSENFHLNGNVRHYIKTAESGNRRVQAFCPDCGTHIYASAAEKSPASYNLRVGTSDQRAELQPTMEIWCDSAMPWEIEFTQTKKIGGQP